jgi:predicted TIM-barrel fold metal-dependent hydrolase
MQKITRRDVLARTALAALAAAPRVHAKASQPSTSVNFGVPPNVCDCHTHIFGDPRRYPFLPTRTYTPENALPAEMSQLHKALGIQRVVIVTPSVYGTDNSATLYGMKARGKDARGVAVIDGTTPERDLDNMDRAGIRGVRLNLLTAGAVDPAAARDRFQSVIPQVQKRGWHIQIYANLDVVSGIKPLVHESPVPVVFDHFGGARASLGVNQPGFADLVDLVHSGQAYVNLSGAYRASTQAPDYYDCTALAQALISANPDRILWGTDWPHPNNVTPPGRKPTEVTQLLQIDDGRLLNQLPLWCPDARIRRKILTDNPARLYGFAL